MEANLIDTTRDRIFRNIHRNNLVYNTCWEDPRIDRQLLELDHNSKVVMITSAGCNVLDYLLDQPAEINAVDVNPRQNSLLHLKLRLIERGTFEDLFAMFGEGHHPEFFDLYVRLRSALPSYAQEFWDSKIKYFDTRGLKKSFYFRGSSGGFAWTLRQCLNANKEFRTNVDAFIDAESLEEQREIYARLEPHIWNTFSRWLLRRHSVLAMVGVPRPQRQLIEEEHPERMPGYLRDNLRRVATELPIRDNYFWRVYVQGGYTEWCCPNYLRPEYFEHLRDTVSRVHTHTSTITDFLKQNPHAYTHYVLLDHQDWLAWYNPDALAEEWEQILRNSQSGTKILFRSASMQVNFLPKSVLAAVRFCPEKTEPLHLLDRVGTYGSLYMAEVL